MESPFLTALCTCPDQDLAETIAHEIVNQRLAACVNIVPHITSIYRWQDKIEQDTEVLMIIKTSQTAFSALTATITALHPYDVPEIIGWPIGQAAPKYLQWLDNSLGTKTHVK